MKVLAIVLSALSAAIAIALAGISWRSAALTLTLRRQFDDWKPALDIFRSSKNFSTLRQNALVATWCNATLPPQTVRAPYCDCVSRAADKLINLSRPEDTNRDEHVMRLVNCLSSRPVWRVQAFWAIRYAVPAAYVFFVVACFLLLSADVPIRFARLALPFFALVFAIVIVVADYTHNVFWAFTCFMVVAVINWPLLPGMASRDEEEEGKIKRVPSCFWWSEYLCSPIFALYVPLMHCGRDFVFASIFTMIGTALGGLGLRSFWCGEVYAEGPKNQFQTVMQVIVWLGIMASCIALCSLVGIYFESKVPYAMGQWSVVLLVITMVISLLQYPTNQYYPLLVDGQITLAALRNIALMCVVIYDVFNE